MATKTFNCCCDLSPERSEIDVDTLLVAIRRLYPQMEILAAGPLEMRWESGQVRPDRIIGWIEGSGVASARKALIRVLNQAVRVVDRDQDWKWFFTRLTGFIERVYPENLTLA